MSLTLANARTYINDNPHVYPPAQASPEALGVGDGVNGVFFLQFPNVVAGSLVVYIGQLQTVGTQSAIVWTGVPAAAYAQDLQQITMNAAATTAESAVAAPGAATVSVANAAGLYAGQTLVYDSGGNAETIIVDAVNLGGNTITADFALSHLTGVPITSTGAPGAGVMVGARYLATTMSDTDLTGILDRNVARYGDDQTSLKGVMNDWIDVMLTNPDLFRLIRYDDYSTDARAVVQAFDKVKATLQAELEGNPRPGKAIPGIVHAFGPNRNAWALRR